ncbi:MAG TPA: 3-oxoacyl-[acyl-carrier-protein] synthase III C-terminal domain-containing protein [Chlamydiales bacterium]|nr:3-oxoacyl-[acyl-carrier-protein] synthase III C-terminal domain-containing protein [Chlamydiales bacterium]
MPCVFDFQLSRPPFETKQQKTFDWLLEAHCVAEKPHLQSDREQSAFREDLRKQLSHVGCKEERIAKRGHILSDFTHLEWDRMEIYRLQESSTGQSLSARMKFFDAFVENLFDAYYPIHSDPPDDLIHVSCTGYLSPSGAQKLVAKRDWGSMTTVTHAYHMGCYGAFPAMRMGIGFLHSGKQKIDIVHTEICSLHLNPSLHEAQHLVAQSLFSDGFMKYSLASDVKQTHFKPIAAHEEIIANTADSMTWDISDWGNAISLSKKIPILIARVLPGYLKTLCVKAGLPESILTIAHFAIHPGGPKILEHIQQYLRLSDSQMTYSFEIMHAYGNMSSATLPHIWDAILKCGCAKHQDFLISLAFGPGLSISGSIMEKICY